MVDNNKRQVYMPEWAPLPNPVGTALLLSEDTRGRGFIISLPGACPRELNI
ncbi:MAG: hypothetical protein U0401_10185 [Anaerolineae bacterium]